MLDNLAHDDFFKNPSFDEMYARSIPNRRKKVMVIDDDLDFRLSVCELLVDEGFTVMTAKDGEAGLNNLIHQRDLPDLILVDIMMPVKTGLEFRKEQLKLDDIKSIPVMFMTGQGIVEGESTLLKPFEDRELIDAVRRFVS